MKTKFINIYVNSDLEFREAIYNLDPFQLPESYKLKAYDLLERYKHTIGDFN